MLGGLIIKVYCSSLWKSCDELRGGMDASQYKDYILTLLFVKYVTDKSKVVNKL
ncbi:type I restriction-modification system subunit M N-terminal domain-containing protein [uncultured Clostridium sp.]|uniref:type I restriction-modification system subunit M N-terminal domain-containing protein n=1 Tax=uncultured Clostridium sp. TaxID=59620 RepID=UPI002673F289|nr:type I restriction-modification system subunit M N-terminal domain-containing protein [uncultured Clostridium sp.]